MIVGIDLGTTNTLVSYLKDGKINFVKFSKTEGNLLPSVVALKAGKFIVGNEAKKLWIKNNDFAIKSLKSFIGKDIKIKLKDAETKEIKKFSIEKIYSQILLKAKTVAEKDLGEKIKDVVISVPAFFDDIARKKTIETAKSIKLNVLRLINEPTAAALGYGFHSDKYYEHKVIVYDLGGGTFDVSLLEINGSLTEIIASDGDRQLGGDDIDALLLSKLIKINPKATFVDAEKIKKELTEKEEIIYSKTKINRTEFESWISELIYKTIDISLKAIYRAGFEPHDFDKVLLVGGSTRDSYIQKVLERELKIPVSREVNPDLAVARGVGIQGALLSGLDLSSMLIDVAPHSISISCVVEQNGREIPNFCAKLINKNTPIPCTVEESFSTLYDEQGDVKIAIYQGESDYEEDNLLLKEFKFDLSDYGQDVKLALSYDLSGKLDINVVDEEENYSLTQKIEITPLEDGVLID